MAVDPDLVDAIAASVADIYREAESALVELIRRHLAAGLDSPTAERRLGGIQALRRSAQAIIAALEADSGPAIRQALADAYRHGWTSALADLPESWFPRSGIGQAARQALAEIPGFGFVEALASALLADVGRVEANLLRNVDDAYRSVQAAAAARILTGTQTRRQAAQAAWQRLVDRGITGFTDRAGRRWRLSSYVEMAARTNTQRTAIQGQVDRLDSLDVHLVYVSDSPQECALCRPWEGKILRTNDGPLTVETMHATRDVAVTVTAAATLDTARTAGLFHPNCRHSISAYVPGVTRLPTDTEDPEGDEARQRQRAIERKIRRYKEREQAALTGEARAAARKRLRAAQAEMRQHLAAHPDLKRLRYREQIGAGNIPPGGRGPAAGDLGPPTQPPIPDVPAPDRSGPRRNRELEEFVERQQARDRQRQQVRRDARPSLGELIPTSDEDAVDRRGEIEAALAEHLEGEYAGLHVSLTSVDIETDELFMKFDVRKDGRKVGSINRTFTREYGETLVASHDLLSLDDDVQGQGFAEAWNGHLEDWYRASGVERIDVHANIDVGGYTWARQGFDFADQRSASEILELLAEEADELHEWLEEHEGDIAVPDEEYDAREDELQAAKEILDRAEASVFGSDDFPTPFEISQCGRRPGQGRDDSWIGKRAMLGSDWQGVKWL